MKDSTARAKVFSRDETTGDIDVEIYCEESADNILKIDLVLDSFETPMDSSSITPIDWVQIARRIMSNYDVFDGLVVLHGTDTMAFTASALSYILGRGVSKPVILTGSQVPLSKTRNDALRNLVTSITLAATQQITEVGLFFNNHLFRGNRSVKVSASDFPAFASPNYKPLVTAGIKIKFNRHKLLQAPSEEESLMLPLNKQKAGNAPGDDSLMGVLKDAHNGNLRNGQPVVLLDVTQVLGGTVDLDAYESACAIKEAGAVSGDDLTKEAALSKLVYLIGRQGEKYSQEDVERQVRDPVLGDLASREIQNKSDIDWAHTLEHRGLSLRVRRKTKKLKRSHDDGN